MDVRSDVDIDADVEILELRIDQRVDADAADAGLERSGGDGNLVADLQRSFLAVEGANLGILNELGVAVVHDRRKIGGGNDDLEIGGVQVAESVEIDVRSVPVPWVTVAPVPEVVVPVVVVVVLLMLLCKVTVALVGGSNPKVRDWSLLTCMMAMSTMTSGRALSRSSTSFSASAI